MIRKTLVATAVAGLLTLGAAGSSAGAAAAAQPPAPEWVPVFYFGTQTVCTKVGLFSEQAGAMSPGSWKCDNGWLMVRPPANG
jgi:hypothetical protein